MRIGAALIFLSLICSPTVFAETENEFPKNKMMNVTADKEPPRFDKVLEKVLRKRKVKFGELCNQNDSVARRILAEYGAIFVARKVLPPPVCMFANSEQTDDFQAEIEIRAAEIEGTRIELQKNAMKALLKARAEAKKACLDITPRGGEEAARRSFADTVRLWNSRFLPASDYWVEEKKLTAEQVEELKSLPLKEQVREVLELEKQGIFFNTWFNDSILYSVAAPGASQHLSLLALDVEEFADETVRCILAKHGWFRTVQMDEPHFTFLGRKEEDLEKYGLKRIETKTGEFWIPNV